MKKHIPLIVAVVTMAITVLITIGFAWRTRRIVALLADPTVRLPVAPRDASIDNSSQELRITLATGGAAYAGGTELSDSALAQLIAANPEKRIVIETTAGVNYEQTKAFLRRLQFSGVKSVTLKTHNQ